jgi:multidrug efflux system outer membrane protein
MIAAQERRIRMSSPRLEHLAPLLRAVLPTLLLAGCAFNAPAPALESTDVPAGFVGPQSEGAATWPQTDWWNSFGNPELSALVTQVQSSNFDLENNERNLRNAQIALREAGFNLIPTPSVTLGTGARYTETDVGGVSNTSNANQPFDLGAGFSYNNILSKPATFDRAVANYDSSVALHAGTILNTLGTTASTYFQLLFTRDQIEVAQQNVANAEQIFNIINAQVEAGVAVPINALNQQIAIESQRANLRNLVQRDLAARSSLALLAGRSVQDFEVSGTTLQNIAVPSVQPGLPSDLLRRRPDLVQAEAALRSADANVDIAYVSLFPQISLTGSINASSTALSQLVSSPDTVLNVSASLVQTLLDNGQRYRNLETQRLNLENALNNYRKAVIGAFNDIEVQLGNIQSLQEQLAVAQRNLEAAEEAFRLAEVRYREGVTDYQTVLNSQNSLFATRNAFLNAKLGQLNAVVDFYQALGGGWELPQSR